MTPLVPIALLILTSYLIYHHVINPYLLSPLSSIPNGHLTSPLSSRWIDRKRSTGTEVLTIYALHQKHGPIVRLGPKELSVNSLHGLRIIYTGAFEKHAFYNEVFVNFNTENLVGMTHNAPHAHQKRMLSKTYSKSFLQESSDMRGISKVMLWDRLMPILKKAGEGGEVLNVLPLFQAVGMDFTSSFLFGLRQGSRYLFNIPEWKIWLEEYERFKYLSRDDRYMGFIEAWCLSFCDRVEASKKQDIFSYEEELPSTNPVVYDQLCQSLLTQKEHDPRPLNLAIASELLDHLVAGHETSGITFTYMMWELSQHPELQVELRKELLTLSPSLQYPDTDGDKPLPSPSAIDYLPLLDAIVRETLRVHSPAPAQLPRVTPTTEKGTSLHGYDNIPGGVRVSSTAYSLHRISDVYPRPLEWLPRRWLEPGDKIHDMRRLFWPFGSGGRMCLGSNFALQEIKLVMAAVYSNYTTVIVDDEGIEQDYAFISLPRGRKLMLRFVPIDE
ncbi:Cytochrome P450 [Penicillium expansum]|uniref:Cytochrome P450 n=1 Tax=Penicillium expansum TaxID=27334 RepID=A0A0A2K5G7_PENEN|nr:Cytochrome P450 [Penicillium expansum]KGO40579.1 Cytochrome P450 [Penicillium expansum]KGO63052.1 Cytochrome P450 [Penicillium expansum]KGO70361.1 Cytochrome P450 [Penicillium expansum]